MTLDRLACEKEKNKEKLDLNDYIFVQYDMSYQTGVKPLQIRYKTDKYEVVKNSCT